MPATPPNLQNSLHDIFGFREFRPHQEEAIEATLRREDVLVVMPTGAGKSLTFQLPAALSGGVTLVISPLIALMRDQVMALREKSAFSHLGTAFLNSSQNSDEQREIVQLLRSGHIKLLYVAPERLRSTAFVDLLNEIQLDRFVVDEAHCISEWGHDFRPDYLAIGDVLAALGRPPLMAVTATATRRVQSSIVANLGMRDPHILIGGFNRPNLHLSAVRCKSDVERDARLAKALPKLIARGGSGLIYCSTRRHCEQVAETANAVLNPLGDRAGIYHAGLEPEARNGVQQGWLRGEFSVLVATNAFGMGIDKSDVRFVVHYGYPESPESYYQEAGRAGRDGRRSRCVILSVSTSDRKLREFFIDNEALTAADLNRVLQKLAQMGEDVVRIPRTWWDRELEWREPRPRVALGKLERAGFVERLGDNSDFMTLRVLRRQLSPGDLASLEADLDRERQVRYARLEEMQGYIRGRGCRRRALLGYFGDHDTETCAFCCDNCDRGPGHDTNALKVSLAEGKVPPPPDITTVHKLLQGLDSLYPAVGKSRLTRILRGSQAVDVEKYSKHICFGALQTISVTAIGKFLEQLIGLGLLHQGEEEEYFVVRVTAKGRTLWQTNAPLEVNFPGRSAGRTTGHSSEQEAGGALLSSAESALFQSLRTWRRTRASLEGVPPYRVLSDNVLREVARQQPVTREELLTISGIGDTKLEQYGSELLELLRP